jgi:hypothetical protein
VSQQVQGAGLGNQALTLTTFTFPLTSYVILLQVSLSTVGFARRRHTQHSGLNPPRSDFARDHDFPAYLYYLSHTSQRTPAVTSRAAVMPAKPDPPVESDEEHDEDVEVRY